LNEQTTTLAPEEQHVGMLVAHLLGIFGIIGALIYWVIKKDKTEEPFVQDQAKEVLNLEINIFVIGMVVIVLAVITGITALSTIVTLLNLGLCIMGALKAKDGVCYRYPGIIRLLK